MPPLTHRNAACRLALAVTCLVLVACGGGGGGDTAAPAAETGDQTESVTSIAVPINTQETAPGPGYFVDATSGSDGNPGSFSAPWRSLSKLTGVALKSGEGFYLRCGGVWRESLALTSTQLVDGSIVAGYGSQCATTKATISGATALNGGWTTSGYVWYRAVPAGTPKITRLYVGNVAHRVARWPNFTSYATEGALSDPASPVSNNTLVVAAANRTTFTGRDLVGATVQVRSKPWTVETAKVAAYDPGTGALTLATPTGYTLAPGNGYVLQDKSWMLDTRGEFFHDTVNNVLYVFPASAYAQTDLNTLAVEGSVRNIALKLSGSRNGLVLRDLALTMSSGHGLQAIDTPGIQISNIAATRNNGDGVMMAIYDTRITNTARSSIGNSTIGENWVYGIDGTAMPRLDVVNNTVSDTGMVDAAGPSLAAIAVGPAGNVSGNTLQNVAFQGIVFSGTGGAAVKNNYLAGYCARLSDCAAIYTWNGPKSARQTSNQSSLVEGNQVLGATANLYGTVGGGNDVVAGIYLDDFSQGATVRGNWIANVPMGIFLHNASSNTVTQNHVWHNGQVALWASMDQTDADYMTGNVFSGNEIVRLVQATGTYPALPVITATPTIWFWHQLLGAASLSSGSNLFQGNRHVEVNGVTVAAAQVRSAGGSLTYSTADWRTLNTAEGTLETPLTFATSAPVLGPELIVGSSFGSSIAPWTSWFGTASPRGSAAWLPSLAGCSGGCAQLVSRTRGDMLSSPAFSMSPGIPHLLSYTAVFGGSATVAVPFISRTVSPWDSFADSSGYVGTSSRVGTAGQVTQYQAFFRPTSNAPAMINMQLETMGVPVAFDNVSIRPVTAFSFPQTADWTRAVHAPRNSGLTVNCTDLGWPAGCTVADIGGAAVTLPVTVAAGTSRLFLRSDSAWRR